MDGAHDEVRKDNGSQGEGRQVLSLHALGDERAHWNVTAAAAAEGCVAGTPVICDGSEAIASVETRISEGACSYPITPSTTMPAVYQAAVADGRTQLLRC